MMCSWQLWDVCAEHLRCPLVPRKLYMKWHIIWKAPGCAWSQKEGYKTQRAQFFPHHTLRALVAAQSSTVIQTTGTTKPTNRSMKLLLCCGVLSAALGCLAVTTLAVTLSNRGTDCTFNCCRKQEKWFTSFQPTLNQSIAPKLENSSDKGSLQNTMQKAKILMLCAYLGVCSQPCSFPEAPFLYLWNYNLLPEPL